MTSDELRMDNNAWERIRIGPSGAFGRTPFWRVPLVLAAASVLAFSGVEIVQGEIVTWRLSGKVAISDPDGILPADLVAGADTNVLEIPDPEAPGGKEFVAFWSYDTSVPDNQLDLPYSGEYLHPLADPATVNYGLSVHIDEFVFEMDTAIEPYTVSLVAGKLVPEYVLGAGDGLGTNHPGLSVSFEYDSHQTIFDNIALSFSDPFLATQEASDVSSDELPTAIDLDDFAVTRIQITGSGVIGVGSTPPPSYFMQAWVQQISRIPEPCTVLIILSGALPYLCRARRRPNGFREPNHVNQEDKRCSETGERTVL